jgi:tetratricopeptide (TPR) repeat protein
MERYSTEECEDDICPRCRTKLVTQDERCTSCGYNLIGVRFFSPNSFLWLSLFLSAMVPIYLSASNWGKIGKTRTKWLWLGGGFVFFVLLFAVLMYLPDSSHTSAKIIGYAVNVPIAFYLHGKQKSVYGVAIQLGASSGSLFKGSLVGLSYAIVALIIAVALQATHSVMKYNSDLNHGVDLFDHKQYEEAAVVFSKILRQDPKDRDALIYISLCNYNLERWDKTAEILVYYLKQDTKNPVAYALLSRVRAKQGDLKQAEKLALQARILDPQIFVKLFRDGDANSDSTHAVP